MVDLPEEATRRPRPRPGPRVAGKRQKSAARAAEAEPVPVEKVTPPRPAEDAATGTKRPRPPQTAATRAATVQAAAAKAAAARRSASKTNTAKVASTDSPPIDTPAKKAATGRAAAKFSTATAPKAQTSTAKRSAAKATATKTAATKTAATTPVPFAKVGTKVRRESKHAALTATARRTRQPARKQSINLTLVVLSVLTVLAAAAVTFLVVERVTTPRHVDPELLPAAKAAYSAMYSFDYTDPDRSVADSLAVLTGDLQERFEDDLNGQVVESYLEVSATTRVDNITVGLQNINDEQTEAVVIAYGTFVVKSDNSGQEPAPEGSECAVTSDGADACVQTLQLNLELVDGTWLVSNVTTLTES